MEADEIREYVLDKDSTRETTPFGPDVLVYKVKEKMFATLGFDKVDGIARVNLKCDPDRAIQLREQYDAIRSGYHMNQKHWNTLILNGSLSGRLVQELVDHSYELVVSKLPKKVREELGILSPA